MSFIFPKSVLVTIAALLTLTCCATKDKAPLPPVTAHYAPEGIVLNLSATPALNSYQEQPHTLRLVVYQLADQKSIQQFSQSSKSLRLLLQGAINNPARISQHELFVQPGEKTIWKLDRLAQTRWIAVVAGYFDLRPQDCMVMSPIPLITTESGWIRKTRSRHLDPLILNLYLGDSGLSNMDTYNADSHR